MDLEHGEIGLECLTDAHADEKFSPRRTRSGRVYDSNCCKTLRRRSQDSFRSRNSSGQSATGSSEDASEQDDCINDDNYEEVLSCLNRNQRCLDSSEMNYQEIPISPPSAFTFDEHLLSPKKYHQVRVF